MWNSIVANFPLSDAWVRWYKWITRDHSYRSRDKDRGVISNYSPANCRNMGIDRQPFTGKVSYLDTCVISLLEG